MHWANDVERQSLSQGQLFEQMWRRRWWSLSPVHTAYGAVRRRRTLQMLKLYATYHYLLRRRRNATQRNDGRQRNVRTNSPQVKISQKVLGGG